MDSIDENVNNKTVQNCICQSNSNQRMRSRLLKNIGNFDSIMEEALPVNLGEQQTYP
jgi:hypothetical protein